MTNKRIPVLLKHIDEEKLELLTTDDFLLIDLIFNEKPLPENLKPRIEHLIEMGIIKQADIGSKDGTNTEEMRDNDGRNTVEVGYKYGTNTVQILSQNQQNIIELIKADGTITAEKIANKLSLVLSTVEKNLRKLKDMGYIARRGEKKGGYWEVLEKLEEPNS